MNILLKVIKKTVSAIMLILAFFGTSFILVIPNYMRCAFDTANCVENEWQGLLIKLGLTLGILASLLFVTDEVRNMPKFKKVIKVIYVAAIIIVVLTYYSEAV